MSKVAVYQSVRSKRRDVTGSYPDRWQRCFGITQAEAIIIESCGYAFWRGKRKDSLALLVPVNALLLFIGQMRYKPLPDARCADSKTFAWARMTGYRHINNEAYRDIIERLPRREDRSTNAAGVSPQGSD